MQNNKFPKISALSSKCIKKSSMDLFPSRNALVRYLEVSFHSTITSFHEVLLYFNQLSSFLTLSSEFVRQYSMYLTTYNSEHYINRI